jgi:hypothetical protein
MNLIEAHNKFINRYDVLSDHLDIETKLYHIKYHCKNYKKNYKFEKCTEKYNEIVNNMIELYQSKVEIPNRENIELVLVTELTKLNRGQLLLQKLSSYLSKYSDTIMNELLQLAAKFGSYGTFIFWLNKMGHKTINSLSKELLDELTVFSINNPDDRLYENIVTTIISKNKIYFQQKKQTITSMLSLIIKNDKIPTKYILRRLKLLSNYIILAPYFSFMVEHTLNYDVLAKLAKYYYVKPMTCEDIYNYFCNYIHTYDTFKPQSHIMMAETLYSTIKSSEEQFMIAVLIALRYNVDITEKYKIVVLEKQLNEMTCYSWFTHKVYLYMDSNHIFCPLMRKIISILSKNQYINKITHQCTDKSMVCGMLPYTRFFPVHISERYYKQCIAMNFALHRLRILIRRKIKNKKITFYSRNFHVLNELKTYQPNPKYKVLCRGSEYYQQDKQKFTSIPPRHLYPGELNIYQDYILKEKADGILINNLPTNIMPYSDVLHQYMIKAEYIEELDLYLVFDIDIPNMKIIDRYNLLRSLHPMTHNTTLEEINTMDQFIDILTKERKQIIEFIKNNSDIKWYPKFSAIVKNPQEINKKLLHFIKNPETIDILDIEPYKCDGFILTPLDGNREIKIKPTHLMTIDVKYCGDDIWVDRENNNISHMITNTNKIQLKKNNIYRCNPIISNINKVIFVVDSYRYDKKRPNPQHIIDSIVMMIQSEWTDTINMAPYYPINKQRLNDMNLINQIKTQEKKLEKQIIDMKPEANKCWLDLGCGSGKAIKYALQFNPKYYLGLDCDVRQLVRGLKYHDMMQDVYYFSPCNLSENWNEYKYKWHSIPNIKFNYIVANFSIMHFFNDNFWSQLEQYVMIGTKFIFNLVDLDINDMWQHKESYLKRNGNKVEYYFEWLGEMKEEPYIDNNMLDKYLKKYGWNIIQNTIKKDPNVSQLSDFYSFFCVEKYSILQ